jgi:hypothetical protein
MLACILLVVLWVRSYRWTDAICWEGTTRYCELASSWGSVHFDDLWVFYTINSSRLGWKDVSEKHTQQLIENLRSTHPHPFFGIFEFRGFDGSKNLKLSVPFWIVSIIFVSLCGLPWYCQRFSFSLRTLLIATTLVAMLLGMIVWASK